MARGICKGCEQERALVAAGLCWKCREKAIEDGSYTPRTGKAAAESAPEPAAEPAVPPPAEPVPVTEPAPPIPAEEPEQGLVPVAFDVRDAELLRRLEESATYNRRSLGAEILFRLDRSFDLNMS